MSYVNADGLEILTAGEQGTAAKRGTSLSSQKKALVMNITGTEVPSAAATPQDHDAFIQQDRTSLLLVLLSQQLSPQVVQLH